MGDIINLVIQTDFQTFDAPDFSVLQDQFEVLGQQRSSQISMVNGNFQAYSRWDVSLTPKQSGNLMIPPLTVSGVSSDAYPILVKAPPKNKRGEGPSFLESTVNLTKAYVQQEIIFTLRFYYQGQLIDGNILSPSFGSAISKKLRNQVNYRKKIGNKVYEVFEWSWAFYPQKSGELEIPEQRFDGRLQYQGRIKIIKDSSEPLHLTILPQASTFPNDKTWLPAKQLQLSEEWQKNQAIRVGDSISRKIQINAKGLIASQLPNLKFDEQSGFHVYPGQKLNQNSKTDLGILSRKTIEMAIVPTKAGEISFPEIRIPWWNTQTDKLETAVLPKMTLTILPSLQSQTLPQTKSGGTPLLPSTNEYSYGVNPLWKWTAIGSAFLWLITVSLWFWLRQRSKAQNVLNGQENRVSKDSTVFSEDSLSSLCSHTDPKRFYQHFNAWKHSHDIQLSPGLEEELTKLKRSLFSAEAYPVTFDDTWRENFCLQLRNHLKVSQTKTHLNRGKPLTPLYPK